MSLYALVKNGQVVRVMDYASPPVISPNKGEWVPYIVVEPPYDQEIQSRFVVTTITDAGVVYEYVTVDRPIEEIVLAKKRELSLKGHEVETQGVMSNGVHIGTDLHARTDLTEALAVMGRNPTETAKFKSKANVWGTADKTTLEIFQLDMYDHIKATRTNEEAHSNAIDAFGLLEDRLAIKNYDFSTGWAVTPN